MKTQTLLGQLSITYLPIGALVANHRNSRTHSKQQIRQIAASIEMFGFTNPVLINIDNTVIAGHGRVLAAKLLGMTDVPTIRLEGLTDDQIRAYVIADNRLAERAGSDQSILAIELQHLLTIDNDFDITVTGFEIPEIDLILEEVSDEKTSAENAVEISEDSQAVAKPGDIWMLGKHRLVCGDSLQDAPYKALMAGHRAKAVFCDPPYNVRIEGNVSGHGSIHHQEFAMASGELTEAEYVAFLATSLRMLTRYSTKGSVHYICMDWRHVGELLAAGRQLYDNLLNICVWVKNMRRDWIFLPIPPRVGFRIP